MGKLVVTGGAALSWQSIQLVVDVVRIPHVIAEKPPEDPQCVHGWIEAGVAGYVEEKPVVTNAIAPSDRGLSITQRVPGESQPG